MTRLVCGCCESPLVRLGGRLVCRRRVQVTEPTTEDAGPADERKPARRARRPRRRRNATGTVPPLPWTGEEPPLVIPEWEGLGLGELPPEEASRHILVLAETGAGKTRSIVLPAVSAMLRFPGRPGEPAPQDDPLAMSILAIDPKHELGDALERLNEEEGLRRDIVRLAPGTGRWRIWIWEGEEPLDMSGQDVAARILAGSAAYAYQRARTREAYFILQAEHMLASVIDVDLAVYRTHGTQGVADLWRSLAHGNRGTGAPEIPADILLLRTLALFSAAVREWPRSETLERYSELARRFGAPEARVAAVRSLGDLAQETSSSVVSTVVGATADLADDLYLAHVELDPFSAPPRSCHLSVRAALNSGRVVVYSPGYSAAATAIGRSLKALYCRELYRREQRHRPYAYVCDEAQRFLSTDQESGEQAFMDRGRAYRAACLLASQSMASLRHACAEDPYEGRGAAALEILMANAATQFYGRTSDIETRERLRHVLPRPAVVGRPHIVDVRPPATLRVGECYYLRAGGGWGRARVSLAAEKLRPPAIG